MRVRFWKTRNAGIRAERARFSRHNRSSCASGPEPASVARCIRRLRETPGPPPRNLGGLVEPAGGGTDLAEGVVDRAQDLGAERTGEVLGRAPERHGAARQEGERPGARRPPRPSAGGIEEARPHRHQPAPWSAPDGGQPEARSATGGGRGAEDREDCGEAAPDGGRALETVKTAKRQSLVGPAADPVPRAVLQSAVPHRGPLGCAETSSRYRGRSSE